MSCERMRDHLIELRLADATEGNRDAHRVAMKRALGDEFVETCKRSTSASQRRCVFGAADAHAVTKCASSASMK